MTDDNLSNLQKLAANEPWPRLCVAMQNYADPLNYAHAKPWAWHPALSSFPLLGNRGNFKFPLGIWFLEFVVSSYITFRDGSERKPLASSSPINSSLAGSKRSFRFKSQDSAAAWQAMCE